jgi:outer membrane lipoprotein-sorting protein
MTEKAKKLKEEYTAEITGQENVIERPCYILVMTSKIENQTYFTRKAWVDKNRFIILKEELYARSGKLLKVSTVNDVQLINQRYYPTRFTLENILRKNSQTEIVLKKIRFDIDIPPGTFSERRLMKK